MVVPADPRRARPRSPGGGHRSPSRGGAVGLCRRGAVRVCTEEARRPVHRPGGGMIVVAANSGLPARPGWYFNLMAEPRARVAVEGRTLAVRAEQLGGPEAAACWQRVLRAAPARYSSPIMSGAGSPHRRNQR
ncbi:nitroreductase/quinone reductase family protein [Actinoplanes nipponensis]